MRIRLVRAEFFHADGQTDGRDEAKSCFLEMFQTRPKCHFLQ